MNETRYEITFENGRMRVVWAMSREQAEILGQAAQIENAEPYQITDIKSF